MRNRLDEVLALFGLKRGDVFRLVDKKAGSNILCKITEDGSIMHKIYNIYTEEKEWHDYSTCLYDMIIGYYEVRKIKPKVSIAKGFSKMPPTDKQLHFINLIETNLNVPYFNGETMEEAQEYISEHAEHFKRACGRTARGMLRYNSTFYDEDICYDIYEGDFY